MRTSKIQLVRSNLRHGLTLLELMVVLVILAIVATVAVQTLQPRVDSERLQTASRLLEQIKTSTLGPIQKYQVDGTPLISGFVADVGRLPAAEPGFGDVENAFQNQTTTQVLSELWSDQSELALNFPFDFRSGPEQPVDYSQIQLPCGWRGPYMQIPVGASSLKDPWGNSPEPVLDAEGCIETVRIEVPLTSVTSEPQTLAASLTGGKVQVTGKVMVDRPEESSIRIALLTPSPDSSLNQLAVLDDENQQPDSFLFSDVTIGLRAIVADVDGQRHVKYVQVSHNGINVVFDLRQRVN